MDTTPDRDRALLSKITWRLFPLLFLCYIVAYIDRINVGFAKLQLGEALGVDAKTFGGIYGTGAGLFFIGYFLFEVPSNLVMQRVGARIWIARIMILWGLISAAMMFIKSTSLFYGMRFLLGAGEAGFFPGVVFYLTFWYPAKERAKTMALFATGALLAGVVGSPISGAILNHVDGLAGLKGWQWLFLLEGIPAVFMGLIVLFLLPDGPRKARWLTDEEKARLQARMDEDLAHAEPHQRHRLRDVFTSGRVWLLCVLYFLLNVGGYGYEMWAPSIINDFVQQYVVAWLPEMAEAGPKGGGNELWVGVLNAVPYLVAMILMVLVGRHSDRTQERRWHVALSAFAGAVGFVLSVTFKNPFLALASLTLAFVGVKCMLGPFWALGTTFLSGTAAAGGIAWINSVGNLGGYVGPKLVGEFLDRTGSYTAALMLLGGALAILGALALLIKPSAPPPEGTKP
jgi:ACS family tartrate transporter-like MFS transporter